jgi:hypothetical protein
MKMNTTSKEFKKSVKNITDTFNAIEKDLLKSKYASNIAGELSNVKDTFEEVCKRITDALDVEEFTTDTLADIDNDLYHARMALSDFAADYGVVEDLYNDLEDLGLLMNDFSQEVIEQFRDNIPEEEFVEDKEMLVDVSTQKVLLGVLDVVDRSRLSKRECSVMDGFVRKIVS